MRRPGKPLAGFCRPLWWPLLLTLLAGCSEPPSTPLRIGVNPWVGYDPLVVAAARGYLLAADVRIVELASSSDGQRALRNGLLEGAALTLDEALRLADDGLALRIIAVLDHSNGADAVLAGAGIDSPAALRGRVVALEPGAVGALVLDRLLTVAGLQPSDVRLRSVEAAQHGTALISGQADAVITFEPVRSWLLDRGYQVLFDSRAMSGEIIDVLVVRADALTASSLPRWAAVLNAWEWGRRALTDEALIDRLAPGADLSPATYRTALAGLSWISLQDNGRWLAGPAAELPRAAAAMVPTLRRLGLLRSEPRWSELLEARPLALARATAEAPR